jgi:D-sedoheptulose 7-phosphate isomerase
VVIIQEEPMERAISQLIQRYPVLDECRESFVRAFEALRETFSAGGKLLLCGNGGSSADCDHIVGELMKGFLLPRRLPAHQKERLTARCGPALGPLLVDRLQGAMPAISLCSHSALFTAIANDSGADFAFAQQVYGLGRAGDALLGISTSGQSRNVFYAFHVARALGLRTIALSGRSGGRLAEMADVTIRVPADTITAIQELHLPVYHALCSALETCFFATEGVDP